MTRFLLAGAAADAERVMKNAFGVKGRQILECARLFDAYHQWHNAGHIETPDEAARKQAAYQMAIAGVPEDDRAAQRALLATVQPRAAAGLSPPHRFGM